jgi:hypothetical protein
VTVSNRCQIEKTTMFAHISNKAGDLSRLFAPREFLFIQFSCG